MAGYMSYEFLDALRRLFGSLPDVFIETGTFRGDSSRLAAGRFREVETTEMSHKLYPAWGMPSNAILHNKMSDKFIVEMCDKYQCSICFFLDAHWDGTGAYNPDSYHGSVHVPLLDELAIIAKHRFPDLVICDDVRLFGKVTEGSDWRSVTIESCLATIGTVRTHFVAEDRLVILR